MKFELLDSETLFTGRAFSIRRDKLRTEHHGSVVLLPVDDEGNLLFVRQYRHAAAADLLELPAGTLDGPDEPPLACATRDVREETGMAAGKLVMLGEFFLVPGYSTERMTVFLATELTFDPLDPDEDEFLQVEKISLADALHMAETGQIPDAKSLASLLMARPHLIDLLPSR